MGNRSMFVGLDVHKETIDVSIAEGDRHGEVRHYGVIASDLEPLDKVRRALVRNWFAKRPRFHVHFTPTYGSWLSLVERWFAELTMKRMLDATPLG